MYKHVIQLVADFVGIFVIVALTWLNYKYFAVENKELSVWLTVNFCFYILLLFNCSIRNIFKLIDYSENKCLGCVRQSISYTTIVVGIVLYVYFTMQFPFTIYGLFLFEGTHKLLTFWYVVLLLTVLVCQIQVFSLQILIFIIVSQTILPYKPLIIIRREHTSAIDSKKELDDEEHQRLTDAAYDPNNYDYDAETVKQKVENESNLYETLDEIDNISDDQTVSLNENKIESPILERKTQKRLKKERVPWHQKKKEMPKLTKYMIKEVLKYSVSELYYNTYLFDKAKEMAEANEKKKDIK